VNSLTDGPIDLSDSTVTLRDAIHAANHDVPVSPGGPSGNGADTIGFQSGLSGTIVLTQYALGIRSDVSITGPGANLLTVSANGTDRVFDITDFTTNALNVTLRDLVITGGDVAVYSGGGILNRENLTIENCTISGNSTGVNGGGIANRPLSGQNTPVLTVVNSTLSGNTADNSGGGIENYGFLYVQDSSFRFDWAARDGGAIWNGVVAHVEDSYFADNLASLGFFGASGGGFYSGDNATSTITGSIFTENIAYYGFGGAVRGGGMLTITDSFLSDNKALGGGAIVASNGTTVLDGVEIWHNFASYMGGGLFRIAGYVSVTDSALSNNYANWGGGIGASSQYGTLEIARSTISSNRAGQEGGGVWNYTGTMTINQSTISYNTARLGGGIHSETSLGEATYMINSTISGNVATDHGGGLHNFEGVTIISHTTITENTAPPRAGSGVWSSYGILFTTTLVHSSIVAGNANTDVDFEPSYFNTFMSHGYNLIGTGNAGGEFNQPGDQIGILDPLLGPLASNGGPTMTHAILTDSPAINAGDPAFVPPPDSDQRGAPFVRVADGRIDIGAFELQSNPVDGDFNDDGLYDGLDIDALVAEIAAGTHQPPFDLTGDGLVNLADRDAWLAEAGEVNLGPGLVYLLGDANLDGVVDGQDFIAWNNHKFQSVAAWTKGDFTADGVVDGQDFLAWNANKFQSSNQSLTPPSTYATTIARAERSGARGPKAPDDTPLPLADDTGETDRCERPLAPAALVRLSARAGYT
jgi:hypothetical protein